MVEIGGKPILWHIMKIYSSYGFNDFILCLGHKGEVIKNYFANYRLHLSDITIDLQGDSMTLHKNFSEPWKVTLVDTGLNTMTGGRLRKVREHLKGEERFLMTYGDGVADVDIDALVKFHKSHGKLATLTAVQPIERFGMLDLAPDGTVKSFKEKPQDPNSFINGGFFVLSPKVIDYVDADDMPWERAPLEKLSAQGDLKAFRHSGFWQCMDTLRDKTFLEGLWKKGDAPWKRWT
jgi:glucose-1-phosphate cytidylyltransferase